jgi:hypothetical protein
VRVLIAYFDESVVSDPLVSGSQDVAMGGCVSRTEMWKEFSQLWFYVLEKEGFSSFHMTDFEHSKKQFAKWNGPKFQDNPTRKLFFKLLLDLIGTYAQCSFGVKYPALTKELPDFKKTYKDCAERLTEECLMLTQTRLVATNPDRVEFLPNASADKVSLVFSKHKDIPDQFYSDLFVSLKPKFPGLVSISCASDMKRMAPLQAADILAFECSHLRWDDKARDMSSRFPLRYLRSRNHHVFLV